MCEKCDEIRDPGAFFHVQVQMVGIVGLILYE